VASRTSNPTDSDIVAGYLANFAGDKSYFWAFDAACDLLSSDPERLWDITLQLIAQAPDELTLSYVSAGPLEDILAHHGPVFIERIEALAKADPKFFDALCGVWGHTRFNPVIFARVQSIIAAKA
jgi:hypothetical protein